jgi:hypothetical protein
MSLSLSSARITRFARIGSAILETEMTPKPGSQWRHQRTGNSYTVDAVLPIKIDGEWRDAGVVIYRNTGHYARLTPDFLEAFEEVTHADS